MFYGGVMSQCLSVIKKERNGFLFYQWQFLPFLWTQALNRAHTRAHWQRVQRFCKGVSTNFLKPFKARRRRALGLVTDSHDETDAHHNRAHRFACAGLTLRKMSSRNMLGSAEKDGGFRRRGAILSQHPARVARRGRRVATLSRSFPRARAGKAKTVVKSMGLAGTHSYLKEEQVRPPSCAAQRCRDAAPRLPLPRAASLAPRRRPTRPRPRPPPSRRRRFASTSTTR